MGRFPAHLFLCFFYSEFYDPVINTLFHQITFHNKREDLYNLNLFHPNTNFGLYCKASARCTD
jgi:hypothetical protein